MNDLASTLMALSALILLLLGCAHLWLTFNGKKLHPRNPALKEQLQLGHLVITSETTFWKAWIGFNASHSYGAILFGMFYGYLALLHSDFLFSSTYLLLLGLLCLFGYVFLARRYWFSTPFYSILSATGLYVASLVTYWGG